MALFLSSFTNHIDAKGRISVPATFRTAVGGDPFAGIVLFRSFTSNCIEGFSMQRMEKMAAATDQLGAFDKTQDDLTAMLFADARPLQFDVSGRVVIPEDLLKHAGISDDAVFVGRGNSFQIWNPAEFAKAQNESLARLQKTHPTLKL
ncbi:MAG: division/cell wall cluster transcriptional repressor MraZ [Alphaproteobacteria bacterium]|nr:division/cell wall cluster transcriptional repressor MraZ [Alphaproteobacteria bacterium]